MPEIGDWAGGTDNSYSQVVLVVKQKPVGDFELDAAKRRLRLIQESNQKASAAAVSFAALFAALNELRLVGLSPWPRQSSL